VISGEEEIQNKRKYGNINRGVGLCAEFISVRI
jgi:hypothetical protein